ncbi:hypothetical protein BT63DRAFT_166772 [Microthyrium microscopicum]|uniref:t-SNARE affecting a late Golgi compartment protein 1 n=1 Tax=Microthyrium microscopicum TaxID=703497 RepID=A0A6A6UND1_9PEZI|nr:hypothetical protein BT63DRAFT_166772 [Microthyrium microscopicum]
MASPQNQDPFLQVQADVLSLLNQSRPLFSSYLRIRSSASSAASPELVEARSELESVLRDLQADLEDLVESVSIVESDPYSFGLEIDEVQRRRQLVAEVGREVEKMQEELHKTVLNAQTKAKAAMHSLPDPDTFDDDDDYAAAFEGQRQQEVMQEQDEVLDDVFGTVTTLKHQAGAMGQELEEQHQLLEEVDVIADRVDGKIQSGLKRLGWVIKQNEDTWSSCCIALLIVVLIVLLLILVLI